LFLALLFKVNRAAALLGSIITNTWISFFTFLLSVKLGSLVMGLRWQEVHKTWVLLMKDFSIADLMKSSILKIILPITVGYFLVAFCCGFTAYLSIWLILALVKYKKYRNSHSN
jgi:uncharacterized protein (DUF2062 family)